MSDNADLEDKTVEALRHYRAALAAVENLEREGASAHRALTRILLIWVAPFSKAKRHL